MILTGLICTSILSVPLNQSLCQRIIEVLLTEGFKLSLSRGTQSDMPARVDLTLRNEAKNSSMGIELNQHNRSETKQGTRDGFGNGAAGPIIESTLSGFSLGESAFAFKEQRVCMLRVIADRYSLEVKVGFRANSHSASQHEINATFSSRVCEKAARTLLSEAMARDLDDNGRPLGTAYLTGLEASKAGYLPLSQWAQRRSIAVTYDDSIAAALFTFGGKDVKLLLASNKAIVNGREVALGGKFILARGSRWFVPDSELADAIG